MKNRNKHVHPIFKEILAIAYPNTDTSKAETEKIICDECGELTDVYITFGSYKFCSNECRDIAKSAMQDMADAEKYHDAKDEELNRRDNDKDFWDEFFNEQND